MKSAIKDLYLGKTANYESIKISAKYKRLIGEYIKLSEEFIKLLTDEQINTLRKLEDLQDGMACEIGSTNFIAGFKLGLLLGVEASNKE